MSHNVDFVAAARRCLREHGFEPEFPEAARAQAEQARFPAGAGLADLRALRWSSIDNAESQDLDQLEWAESLPGGRARIVIAIADVDELAPLGTPIDLHAAFNTTSVYAGGAVFPMIPDRLSTSLTSLLPNQDRTAVVTELALDADANISDVRVQRAWVHSHAKLTYEHVDAWLEGTGPLPDSVAKVPGLEADLRLQAELGARLKGKRHARGALELETIEARPVVENGRVRGLTVVPKNRARELVEDFMLAANSAVGDLLDARDVASIRRVVRAPARWDRLVELARAVGATLPSEPDAPALAAFLSRRRREDPAGFGELSLSVVKLMGPGEYIVERSGEDTPGHFGLAVTDYTHSTAPNRRYADLITQRILKAIAAGQPSPYAGEKLADLAARCTAKENDARKVERWMRKLAAAVLLHDRVGEMFDAVITGVSPRKGTFARLFAPAVEGRVVKGEAGMDVGDRVRLRLLATDIERAYVDFAAA